MNRTIKELIKLSKIDVLQWTNEHYYSEEAICNLYTTHYENKRVELFSYISPFIHIIEVEINDIEIFHHDKFVLSWGIFCPKERSILKVVDANSVRYKMFLENKRTKQMLDYINYQDKHESLT